MVIKLITEENKNFELRERPLTFVPIISNLYWFGRVKLWNVSVNRYIKYLDTYQKLNYRISNPSYCELMVPLSNPQFNSLFICIVSNINVHEVDPSFILHISIYIYQSIPFFSPDYISQGTENIPKATFSSSRIMC